MILHPAIAADHAVRYALSTQQANGSWDGPLSSRTFETALAAMALQQVDPTAAQVACHWLTHNLPEHYDDVAFCYETGLRALALQTPYTADLRDPRLYNQIVLRKTLALYALSARAGVEVQGVWPEAQILARLDDIYTQHHELNIKGWALSDTLAGYAILLAARGRNELAARVANDILAMRDASDGSWFQNTAATCLAMCAVEVLGEAGLAARQQAAGYLRSQQQEDGGWSYCHIPVWDTAVTMTALGHSLSPKHPAMRAGLAYLLSAQNADGGWGFYPGLESENDTTSAVMDAIGTFMPLERRLLAVRYLYQSQQDDGLWPVWRRTEQASTEVVAHIVTTLRNLAPEQRQRLTRASVWLGQQQAEDGTWTADWCANIPYAIFSVVRAAFLTREQRTKAIGYLRSSQNRDGGWGGAPGEFSNASATAFAVLACRDLGCQAEAARGALYLAHTQTAEGTWHSPCEVIGPRPLRYSIHASTHAFCTHALLAETKRQAAMLPQHHEEPAVEVELARAVGA